MRGYYVSYELSLEKLATIAKTKNDAYKVKESERNKILQKVAMGNVVVPF